MITYDQFKDQVRQLIQKSFDALPTDDKYFTKRSAGGGDLFGYKFVQGDRKVIFTYSTLEDVYTAGLYGVSKTSYSSLEDATNKCFNRPF